ncbi:MAG TPA: DUF84 family protein, partial [Blastocatellia bacterium]|nr:DUF84 family protein [Blastocatellia bacterium]
GSSPSIEVPRQIAAGVFEGGDELSVVIDRIAGEHDVRSKQGTWGVLTLDLLTRRQSFEAALLAALAPFYNKQFYKR